jgi:hypothetical protein
VRVVDGDRAGGSAEREDAPQRQVLTERCIRKSGCPAMTYQAPSGSVISTSAGRPDTGATMAGAPHPRQKSNTLR